MVRDFSETIRLLMEKEFSHTQALFPKTNRLKGEYRYLLIKNVFAGFGLKVDRHGAQKRLVLYSEAPYPRAASEAAGKVIPFMAWSAGQRESVPLLMGLYWLMPSAKVTRRVDITWVTLEEPEMGLHPNAISVVLLLVLELLWRGYRVCISTHSSHVLDLVWAIRTMQVHESKPEMLIELFSTDKTAPFKLVAGAVFREKYRVFFNRQGETKDISNLDPSSLDEQESGWGGLSELSTRVNEIVGRVVSSSSESNIDTHASGE